MRILSEIGMNGSRMSFSARSDVCRFRWDRENIFFRNEHKVEYVNGVVYRTHTPTPINRLLQDGWQTFYTIFHNHRESIFRKSSEKTVNERSSKRAESTWNEWQCTKVLVSTAAAVRFVFVCLSNQKERSKEAVPRNNDSDSFPQNRYIPPGLERSVGEQLKKLACFLSTKNEVLREMGGVLSVDGFFYWSQSIVVIFNNDCPGIQLQQK